MYNFKFLVGGAALMLATSALAGGPEVAPVDNSGFYVGVNGGLNFLTGWNNYNNGLANFANNGFVLVNGLNAFVINYNYQSPGWNLGGAVGYRFNAWRVEVEGSYLQHNANNNMNLVIVPAFGAFSLNTFQIVTVMANGYYDFDLGNSWVPYLGLGLGWGQTQRHFAFVPNNLRNINATITRNGFAFQGVLGLDYKLTDNLRLGISYHGIGITGVNNNNNGLLVLNGNNFFINGNNGNNSFLFENKINLGLSYFF